MTATRAIAFDLWRKARANRPIRVIKCEKLVACGSLLAEAATRSNEQTRFEGGPCFSPDHLTKVSRNDIDEEKSGHCINEGLNLVAVDPSAKSEQLFVGSNRKPLISTERIKV